MNTLMKGIKEMMNAGKKPVADESPSDSLLEKKGQKEGNPEAGKVEKDKEKHPQGGATLPPSQGKKDESKGEKVGTVVLFYKGQVEAHDPSNSPSAIHPNGDTTEDDGKNDAEATSDPLPAIVIKGFDNQVCQLFVMDPEGSRFVKAHFSDSPKDRHWTHSK
jgi:hypothetical protein